MNYIPHTKDDISKMISVVGCSSIEELVSQFKPRLEKLNLDNPMSEMELVSYISNLSEKNKDQHEIFCQVVDHMIITYQSVINHLVSRGEFLTSYTPYQAEISQGVLQVLYEFQSLHMPANRNGCSQMPLFMMVHQLWQKQPCCLVHIPKRNGVFVEDGLNPAYLEVLKTYCDGTELVLLQTQLMKILLV